MNPGEKRNSALKFVEAVYGLARVQQADTKATAARH